MGQLQYGKKIVIPPLRGEIQTSDGFPIASNQITYRVVANPKEVKDLENTAELLSPLINVDIASISANLSLDKYWVAVSGQITVDKKNKIEKLKLPGIAFEQQSARFYPEASMAAQLIGFVGKDEDGLNKGYFGLEGYYDRLLSGKEGQAIQIHDAFGKPILSRISTISNQIDGSSLILNIDRTAQFAVEKRLKEGIEKYDASSGMAIVMEPLTGNILAMASFPTFDPKNYKDFEANLYKNPVVSDTYEPGSTFKPLIMSAALDEKIIDPKTKCNICSGPVSIGGYTIHTWNDKYYPNITMTDVIMHSDNTGMVFVGQKLGLDKMLGYLKEFGIGSFTGIDLQGEVAPFIKQKKDWYIVDLATASFGQGISITPMELLSAVSAIANKGKRMEPHVVGAVKSPDGSLTKISPKEISSPISEETAKVMTEIMINAVNKGEAQWARLRGYRIAGKTGTASIPIQGHYDPTHTIASFIGFAPADKPKFIMLVIFNKPKSSIYGAETAAPVFFNIARDLLTYYGIPPDE
ncbi:MAG: penicillin-binding protein 2 [Actinobacteria bacterium]|nr:penicillin-binding protein 2 [Actinomycetota bacterium]